MKNNKYLFLFIVFSFTFLFACSSNNEDNAVESSQVEDTEIGSEGTENTENSDDSSENNNKKVPLQGKLQLSKSEGRIGDEVQLSAEDLIPNEPLTVVYVDMEGRYEIEDNNYSLVGTIYDEVERELISDTANGNGKWSGTITIPEGFGDDHNIIIYQDDNPVAKANFFVQTVFSISPESGPIGTEIEIIGEGLSWKMYGSIWHLNYDNKYTGMLTGVSTNGSVKGVIRAAGAKGKHTIAIESGSSGSPFMNRNESAINYISTQYFSFEVTDDEPNTDLLYVEEPPKPAGDGIQLPEPVSKDGVTLSLTKDSGIVDEEVELSGTGFPENEEVVLDWHTMVGNRVTPEGFSPSVSELGKVKTDENGSFNFPFSIPDDLGGLPHLIEAKVNDEVVGQTYLRILPSIVSITPAEAPAGTLVTIEIKGSGWTEYDNALAVTYDNASVGYICGFNSQGTIKLPFLASGEPGYHMVDIYPSIYQGKMALPDIYLKPQLSYRQDHPGTGIPALRTFFKVTEE